MEFAEDVWSQEAGCDRKAATARKGKDLEPVPLKQQRCRKMRIRSFQRESEREMRKWMGAHRKTYNAVQIPKYSLQSTSIYFFQVPSVDKHFSL